MANMSQPSNPTMPHPPTVPDGRAASRDAAFTRTHNRELLRVRAHWLVDLFPDELVIQEKMICVIRNEFLVSYTETIPVKDIGRVVYINTLLFGGLRIIGKNTQHELHIKGLGKKAAIEAKDIIEGLLLEDSGVIDVPHWVETDKRRDILASAGSDPELEDELDERAHEY
ncbi:MAG TPA: hypothetical protein VK978_01035 [Candidatus Saccharimonadales bacterium]|nr:hypothetical protein [Candidatus Saccharimonadales bacterium]